MIFFRLTILISILIFPILAFAQLPLLQINDLEYKGAFIVPADDFGISSSNYAAGIFTLSSDKEGFFLAGHNVQGAIAEFDIPQIINSDSLQDLQYATIRQNFESLMGTTPDGNPQGIDRIAGMKVIGNKLFVNAIEYYDAPADNSHTTFVVEDADSLATSQISGYYHVLGEAHAGGWISEIPSEWSSDLGGDYIMGNSSKFPINARSTMGVSAFVFDPADLINNTTGVIPSTTLIDYDLADPLYEDYSDYANALYNLIEVNGSTPSGHTFEDADAIVGNNSLWTSSSQASFGFIIPGTRTYMTVGSSGGHNSGIGYKATQNNGNLCGGPCPYDADDEYNYYWLWDIDDLIDVKNGIISAYDVRPYDYGVLDLPFQYDDYYSAPEFHEIVGGDFDIDNGILYLTVYDGGASGSPYQRNPVILTYHISSSGVAVDPTLGLEQMYTGFDQPTKITNAGDGTNRLFVAERTGKIKVIDNAGTVLPTPFLDISSVVSTGSEQGLLGLAFHPDYGTNGYFYVNYTNALGNTEIARYQVSEMNPNIADINSGQIILSYGQPYASHNGGDINFGPQDGYLYIASGDGGGENDPGCEAQDSTSALGKLLRIDVDVPEGNVADYLIPPDNPFVGAASADETIWAYGLQNPWRFSFDRDMSDLWVADIGQNLIEEVNYSPAPLIGGHNYGWKYMEGSECIVGNTDDPACGMNPPECGSDLYQNPLFEYTHDFSTGGTSITGGYVYRGCKYTALKGLYICADYNSGNFWTVDKTGSKKIHNALQASVSTFGEDDQGEIYCASSDGNIYRVIDNTIPKVLTLTAEDSPLEGSYRAYETIIVDEAIELKNGKVTTLIAPKVILKNQMNAEANENLIIRNNGCQ